MTEVPSKAQRRRFTAAYKKRILAEVDARKERGEVGALLRREGLYSSHIAAWRSARDRGDLARLEPKKRGPKPKVVDVRDKDIARTPCSSALIVTATIRTARRCRGSGSPRARRAALDLLSEPATVAWAASLDIDACSLTCVTPPWSNREAF